MNTGMVSRRLEMRLLPSSPSVTLLQSWLCPCYSSSEPKPFLPSCPSLRCTFPDIHKAHSLTALRYLYEMWPHPRHTPWLALYLKYHIPCLTYNSIQSPLSLYPVLMFSMNLLLPDIIYLLFTVCFPPM